MKVDVVCDVAMTLTPNVLTSELRDLLNGAGGRAGEREGERGRRRKKGEGRAEKGEGEGRKGEGEGKKG